MTGLDSVKEIALIFCSAAVLSAAVGLLSGKALQKSMKYITALIMLCALLGGITGTVFDFNFNISRFGEVSSDTAFSLSEYQAAFLVEEILSEKGIGFRNISAKATKTEDGGIIISEVRIKGADDEQSACAALEENGIDCRVVFE